MKDEKKSDVVADIKTKIVRKGGKVSMEFHAEIGTTLTDKTATQLAADICDATSRAMKADSNNKMGFNP